MLPQNSRCREIEIGVDPLSSDVERWVSPPGCGGTVAYSPLGSGWWFNKEDSTLFFHDKNLVMDYAVHDFENI